MRIRTIKPEFFTDSKVRSLPFETRLLFIGLWSFADDKGRFENDIQLIKALIFPSDDVNVCEKLLELQRKKMITRYRAAKKDYFLIPSWHRHQRINRPSKPRTPPPVTRRRHTRKPPGAAHGALTEPSSHKKGREGKGKEVKEAKEVCLSNRSSAAEGRRSPGTANPVPGQSDGQILEELEPFFPKASIEKLLLEFPPERLVWAARRTRLASEDRPVKKPASYLLRILRDDEQWQRYICDQYALGRAAALKRQRELVSRRKSRDMELENRRKKAEDSALGGYLDTIPNGVEETLTELAVQRWGAQNGNDIEEYREKGWLLKIAEQGLYKTHVRRAWKELGRPARYMESHLKQLQRGE